MSISDIERNYTVQKADVVKSTLKKAGRNNDGFIRWVLIMKHRNSIRTKPLTDQNGNPDHNTLLNWTKTKEEEKENVDVLLTFEIHMLFAAQPMISFAQVIYLCLLLSHTSKQFASTTKIFTVMLLTMDHLIFFQTPRLP